MAGIEFGENNGKNHERLEKWLKPFEKDRRDVITSIAHRVAMRSAVALAKIPDDYAGEDWAEPLTLQSMRCLLLSSLAGNWPSEDNKISSAARSALSAADSAAAIWESVRRDLALIEGGASAKDLLAEKLWIVDGYEAFEDYGWSADDRDAVKAFGQIDEYKFWGQWLLDSYDGRKRSDSDWEMLKEIGLIEGEIWEKGETVEGVDLTPAKAIARRIREIEGEYRKQSETIKRARVEEQVIAQLRVASHTIESAEGLKRSLDQIVFEAMVDTNEKPEALIILESISSILAGISSAATVQNFDEYKNRILELEGEVLQLTCELEAVSLERDQAKDGNKPKEWKIFNEELAKGSATTINWGVRIGLGYFLYQINPALINELGKIIPSIK